jgi:predicted metalloprotease
LNIKVFIIIIIIIIIVINDRYRVLNSKQDIQGKGRSQKNNNKTITTTKKTIKQTTEHIVRVK